MKIEKGGHRNDATHSSQKGPQGNWYNTAYDNNEGLSITKNERRMVRLFTHLSRTLIMEYFQQYQVFE